MSTMLRKIIIFILVILSLVIAAAYLIFTPRHWSQVVFQQKILPIERDQYNIATIHASSMEQYLYSLGTIFAEDRLFTIFFRNKMTQGRLSEALGQKTLDLDKFMRELNFRGWSSRIVQKLKKQNITSYEKLKCLTDGMNNRVENMYFLPFQFYLTGFKWQPFTVQDIFNINFVINWQLSMNYLEEYTRSLFLTNFTKQQIQWLLPNKKQTWAFKSIPIVSDQEIPDHLRTSKISDLLNQIYFDPAKITKGIELEQIQQLQGQAATNTWSVSGNYTESGKPLLVNDPHLEVLAPSTFYQIKINYTHQGKPVYFTGFIPTGGLIPIGISNYFATGCSISHGDNQDLYQQKVQGEKYLLDGEWKPLKIRKELIKYKTSKGMVQELYTVRQTHRGPIINYIFGSSGSFKIPEQEDISLAWSYFNQEYKSVIEIILYFTIDNLKDLQSFVQGDDTKTLFPININFITKDNHILMQQAGYHPIRRNSDSGNYIKDGTTSEHDWIGFLPSQYRMHLKDPKKGFIIHSNNRVAQDQYFGGYLNHTIYTARADRIDEMIRQQIKSGRKIGMEFAKKVIHDTVDVYCRQIMPQILYIADESRQTHEEFDCNFTKDSYLASMYQVFMFELYHLTKPLSFQKLNLISFYWSQQALFNYIHKGFQGKETNKIKIRQAWKNMIQHLNKRFETQDITRWKWGQLHKDVIKHTVFGNHPWLQYIFNTQSQGFGNMHTPNMAKMQKLQFSNFQTSQRADYRAIFTFGSNQASLWTSGTGTSQSIFSRHHLDQWQVFKQEDLIPIEFKPAQQQQL